MDKLLMLVRIGVLTPLKVFQPTRRLFTIQFYEDGSGTGGLGQTAQKYAFRHYVDHGTANLVEVYADPRGNNAGLINSREGKLYHMSRHGIGHSAGL